VAHPLCQVRELGADVSCPGLPLLARGKTRRLRGGGAPHPAAALPGHECPQLHVGDRRQGVPAAPRHPRGPAPEGRDDRPPPAQPPRPPPPCEGPRRTSSWMRPTT